MKINDRTDISKKFFDGFERTKNIEYVIVHGTAGGDTLNFVYNTKLESDLGKGYQKGIGLFHFLIEPSGKIYQIMDTDVWCHHASCGKEDMKTIGIELQNPDSHNAKPYTEEQYQSLLELFEYLKEKYPTIDKFVSHNRMKEKFSKGTKECPGKGFDWKGWAERMSAQYVFERNLEKQSMWDIKSY